MFPVSCGAWDGSRAPKILTVSYGRFARTSGLLCLSLATAGLGGCSSTLSVFSNATQTNSVKPKYTASSRLGSSSKSAWKSQTTKPRSNVMFPEGEKWGKASPRMYGQGSRIPKGGGVYKVGNPYQVAGVWYYPRKQPNYDRVGEASWYGADFHGRKTSNGEIFDMYALTAAHPTLPMPSYAYVTNLSNNRTILVRINDRGPYVKNRIIDLSKASADALDLKGKGLGRVRVKYAGPAPLNGDDSRERQFLANRGGSTSWQTASVRRTYARPAPDRPAPRTRNNNWSPAKYRASLR